MYSFMKNTRLFVLSAILLTFLFSGVYPSFSVEDSPEGRKSLEQAIWEYKHQNYEEAYDILKELREKQPQSSMAAYYLGITCKQMQNYTEAKPNLEAAVTLKPKIKNALPELIDLLYKKGQLEEAKKWIEVAEGEDIHPAQTAFFKGLVLLKEGEDIDGAIESFEKAKTLDPSLAQTVDYICTERLLPRYPYSNPAARKQYDSTYHKNPGQTVWTRKKYNLPWP